MERKGVNNIGRISVTVLIVAATLGLAMAGGLVGWQGIANIFKGDSPEKTAKVASATTAKAPNNATCAHTTAFSGMPFALSVEGCSVTGEAGSVTESAEISVTAIDSLPPLAAGMVNVTRGHAGYRLSPAGLRFARPVTVELGYDSLLLPRGHSAREIRTFLYNSESRHWEALPRDSVMEGSQNIVSQSKQAGEMVNAIVQLPELPESKAFTPTMLTELEAAHPAAGVTVMEPPTANSQGTASLSYPISVPAGRNGLQPNLSVSYSSEAGNGLLGMGWDMQLPAITVDSKWGAPRYDNDHETECYSYNGQELLPSPRQRNGFIPRQPERRFRPRVESGFEKIVRHGDSPRNYWWEVTDKEGTRHFYGSYDGATCDTSVLMSDSDGNIGHWPLCRVIDINGNHMRYCYSKRRQYSEYQQAYPATSPARNAPPVYLGQQLWPEAIQYTGHDGDTGRYKVVFCSASCGVPDALAAGCPTAHASGEDPEPETRKPDGENVQGKPTTKGGGFPDNMEWTTRPAGGTAVPPSPPPPPADAPCSEESAMVTICLESPCANIMDFSGSIVGISRKAPVFGDGSPLRYPVLFDFNANQYRTAHLNGGNCSSFMVCPEVTYHAVVQPPGSCSNDPVSFTFRINGDGSLTVANENGIPMTGAHAHADAGHIIRVPVECDCNLPSTCYDCAPGEECDDCPPILRKKIYIGVQDNFCLMGRLPHCLFSLTRVNDPLQRTCHYTTGHPKIQPVNVRVDESYCVHGYWFGDGYQATPVDFVFSVDISGCVTLHESSGILSPNDPDILVEDFSCHGPNSHIELLMPVVPRQKRVRLLVTDDTGSSGCVFLSSDISTGQEVEGVYPTDADGYTGSMTLQEGHTHYMGESDPSQGLALTGLSPYTDYTAPWTPRIALYIRDEQCVLHIGRERGFPAPDTILYESGLYTFAYHVPDRQLSRNLHVKKVSPEGEAVAGAVFSTGGGMHYTTLANGLTPAIPLHGGETLALRETAVPPGFVPDSAEIRIQMGSGGHISIASTTDYRYDTAAGVLTITNTRDCPTSLLRVQKRDSATGAPLQGALISFRREGAPEEAAGTALTDTNGLTFAMPLRCDVTYRVEETFSPRGYSRDPGCALVRLLPNDSLAVLESRSLSGVSRSDEGWLLVFQNAREDEQNRLFPRSVEACQAEYAYDNTISTRNGYRQSSKEKLSRIMVFYRDSCVRRYTFCYGTDFYGRARLVSIHQWGADTNQGSHVHRLDYYQDADANHLFRPSAQWNLTADPLWMEYNSLTPKHLRLLMPDMSTGFSALGGSRTLSAGINCGADLGMAAAFLLKTLSAGVYVNGGVSFGKGITSLLDINGDGLPDRVVCTTGVFGSGSYVCLQKSDGSGFETRRRPLDSVHVFLRDFSDNVSAGMQASSVIRHGGVQKGWGNSWTSVYFADMDGDGLTDLVSPKGVKHFIRPQSPPQYTFTDCLPPQAALREDTVRVTCDDRFSFADEGYQRDRSGEIRYDLVRVWQADLDNAQLPGLTYSICAPVHLAYDSTAMENFCGRADSVIVSIEYYGSGLTGRQEHILLWSDVIGDSDTMPHGPDFCSLPDPTACEDCRFRILKTDLDGNPMGNVEFTIGDMTVITDNEGLTPLLHLAKGRCADIRELASPCGSAPSSLTVCRDNGCIISAENPGITSVHTEMVDGVLVYTFTLVNDCRLDGSRGGSTPPRLSRAYTNPNHDLSALTLAKGDRLYFRLRPQNNGVRKKAVWDPAVTPYAQALSGVFRTDENGRIFGGGDRASESQLLQGDSIFRCPAKGNITVESAIPASAFPLTDSVRYEIWHNNTRLYHNTVEAGLTPPSQPFTATFDVDSLDALKFKVVCRSNVNMHALHWYPKVCYNRLGSGDGAVATVIPDSAGTDVRLLEYTIAPWHDCYHRTVTLDAGALHTTGSLMPSLQPAPFNLQGVSVSASLAGKGCLTVKQDGVRVYAREVAFASGTTCLPENLTVTLLDDPAKPVYVSFCVDDPVAAASVSLCEVTLDGTPLQAAVYTRQDGDMLTGSLYGGWGQFQYQTDPVPDSDPLSLMDMGRINRLSALDAATLPYHVDTSGMWDSMEELRGYALSDACEARYASVKDLLGCLPMWDDAAHGGRSGFYANAFIRSADMNIGGIPCPGFGEEDALNAGCTSATPHQNAPAQTTITPHGGLPLSDVLGARSPKKKSSSETFSLTYGRKFHYAPGMGVNLSSTYTLQDEDFMDLNGDGFPDIISRKDGVWYSFPAPSLWESASKDPFLGGTHHRTHSASCGLSFSAEPPKTIRLASNSDKGATTPVESEEPADGGGLPQLTANGSSTWTEDRTLHTLMDINGDGLPDRVYANGENVALNTGYGFQTRERWALGSIGLNRGDAFSSSFGLSFAVGNMSVNGGISGSESYNRSEEMLADINGDGKPDRVVIFPDAGVIRIHYNTGCGFNGCYDRIDMHSDEPALWRWTTTRSSGRNAGVTGGFAIGTWAKISGSAGGDASISLSSSVIQFMDMDGDGYADLVISPDDHTLYVRHSSLGRTGLLKTVTNPLGGSITLGYRQTVANVFHSRRWVMDTLLVCDSLPGDGADTRMTTWAYENGYHDRTEREFLGFARVTERHHNTMDGNTIKRTYTRYFRNDSIHTKGLMLCEEIRNGGDSLYVVTANRYGSRTLTRGGDTSAFVTLDTATVCYYEGGATAHIRRQSTFAYENLHGNLVRQTDTSTGQPLVTVDVSYHADPGNHRVGVPKCVEVAGCKKRTTETDSLGRITAFRDFCDNTHSLTTRLQYDQYGNVITMRSPNTTVHYTYDNHVHTYPTAITDTFGITSQMQDYDFRFGVPRTIVDQAGSRMEYTLDAWGRTVTIRGPKEIEAGVPFTIRYTYAGKDAACRVSTAMTEHFDPQHPNNPIKTYTYCDGLGRIVQTRKEAAVNGVEKLVVSGHTVVDALGRTVATYYPTEIHKDSTLLRFITDNSAPAATATYDVLDRPLVQTAPDGSTTTFQYYFNGSHLGRMLFSTTTTDANSHVSTELKDACGRPWAVQAAGQPFVYFEYNLAGDNTKVYSSVANDWERNYTYDWLGRRLTYTEGGLSESYTYNGSNLATHTQSWLENGNPHTKAIHYHYTAHRLDSVGYDDALSTIYHYDQYGRVDSLYDESGVVCYQYGNMGEVTQETRIYALPFLNSPLALTTQFRYDSWGRVDSIFYPDGERLNYQYDLGGQLQSITNNSSYTYLDNVTYDRFGAKVSQEYGNGITTDYSYNNVTRRLMGITTTGNGTPLSQIQYAYDLVGNVTQVTSSCPWLPNHSFTESFSYDASDQLVSASETNSGSYQLAVTYGNWGKISSYDLTQTDLQHNVTTQVSRSMTYPSNINNIGNSQTMFAPTMENGYEGVDYTFGINGSLRKREVQHPMPYTEYYLFNSASNLKAYSNNLTDFAYYGYNAANTRAYKLGLSGSSQWVNGQQQSLHLGPQQAMFYPNAYLNFNQNGEYTKHYYNGSERIASRLGDNQQTIEAEANDRLLSRIAQTDEIFKAQIGEMAAYEEPAVNVPARGNGEGTRNLLFPTVGYDPIPAFTDLQPTGNTSDIFYYHMNHLGSTAYVTDNNATITQGFLYAPFGEITTEFNATFGNDIIPKYSFNAKELDEETGMYYYEARYYKPPVFTSRDPMFEKYFWMTPYAYCSNNPVKYVDPTGKENWPALKWARENMSNKGIPFGRRFSKETGYEYKRGTIPEKAYCYEACFIAYMNSSEKLTNYLIETRFSDKYGGYRCRNAGIDWFKDGNGTDRSFVTDITKGELGDIVFMGESGDMQGHAVLLDALPISGSYINERGDKVETITLKVLSTSSYEGENHDTFGNKTYVFEKQKDGSWKQESGHNDYYFKGYGQINKNLSNE